MSDLQTLQEEHLRKLAERPNTTVYTVQHDRVAEPWPAARLRRVMEDLVGRALAYGDEVCDFRVRKELIEDPEALAFYRAHPKMFHMITDRAVMREPHFRSAITGLLHVRDEVERGRVAEGHDADAMATRTVMTALSGTDLGASSAPPA